jgi:putative ABC transport system permease protein
MKFDWFRRDQREAELDAEIRSHLDEAIRDRIERGETPEQARANALREFGNVGLIKEATREMWGWAALAQWAQDLRFGARMFGRMSRKQPGFTLLAALTLALGIGANTAIFSLVNAVLLRKLPFTQPERLVQVYTVYNAGDRYPFTLPNFCDYREQSRSVTLAAFANWSANLAGAGESERAQGARVSADVFELLGVKAALGRTLLPSDDRPGHQHVVMISHGFWQRRFAANPNALGQRVLLSGISYEVVGVLPPDFLFPFYADAELVVPLAPEADPLRHARSSVSFLRVVARLKPNVTPAQAAAELNGITNQLRQQYPKENGNKLGVRVVKMYDGVVGDYRRALWILFGAVALVLLIACTNLANLLLARAAGRRKEMTIRAALGASRARLVRQLLAESLLLALAGAALGLLLAYWGGEMLLALSPTSLPRAREVGLDARALGFTLVVTVFCGLLFGLAPAWQTSAIDLNQALREGGKGTGAGAAGDRLRNLLVIAEVALALVLLIGAGLFLRSFQKAQEVKPGFDASNVLLVRLALPPNNYPDSAAITRFTEQAERRLATIPGMQAIGVVNIPPLSGQSASVEFNVVGRPPAARDKTPRAQYRIATPGYFRALGIPLVAGRELSERDTAATQPVLLINQQMAERYFAGRNPVGEHLAIDDNDLGPRTLEIIGVVGDVKQLGIENNPTFDIYLPLSQTHADQISFLRNNLHWALRATTEPLTLAASVKRELQVIDRDVPASSVRTMEQSLATIIAPRRFNLLLLGIFAGAALLLAAAGIYAVVAYAVAQRAQEIGIRLALGAQTEDVLQLVIARSMRPALLGVGTGLVAAFALTRLMTGLLFGVSANDPLTFVAIALLLLSVALLACWIPARRAVKVDPMIALRSE